jgi:hypothetical protein
MPYSFGYRALVSRYDVYTPTQNIVFHSFQPNPDGHGPVEWLKPRFEQFRRASLQRIRTILELPNGIEGFNAANFGVYGLGKRRTLKQLADFVQIDMEAKVDRPESVRYPMCPFFKGKSPLIQMEPHFDSFDFRFLAVIIIGSHLTPTFLQSTIYTTNQMIWTHSPNFHIEPIWSSTRRLRGNHRNWRYWRATSLTNEATLLATSFR